MTEPLPQSDEVLKMVGSESSQPLQATQLGTLAEAIARRMQVVDTTSESKYREDDERREKARWDQIIRQRWAESGAPGLHAGKMDLRTQTPDGPWKQAFESLRAQARHGGLYALVGPSGVGKTQMATCLLRDCCEQCSRCRYVKAGDLFRQLQATFDDDAAENEYDILAELVRLELLVIDEIHEIKHSEYEQRTLTSLLDRRYDATCATVLISNYTPVEFQKLIGPSVASRMLETGVLIECTWPSFRKRKVT